jgi:hypothetical protein
LYVFRSQRDKRQQAVIEIPERLERSLTILHGRIQTTMGSPRRPHQIQDMLIRNGIGGIYVKRCVGWTIEDMWTTVLGTRRAEGGISGMATRDICGL